MFRIEYNHVLANQYADNIVKKLDKKIERILKPGFSLTRKLESGTTVNVVVSQNGFTRQFLNDYRENTDLLLLLRGDIDYLRRVITRVKNDSREHFVRLDNDKYNRCYPGQRVIDDFHTIISYLFVKLGYESNLINLENIVDDFGLKVCPYCGHTFISSVKYQRGNGKLNVAKAQVDHFFPKGLYPFLALSYANIFACSCPS